MIWQSDGARYEGLWHMDRRLQGTFRLGSSQASATGAIEYTGEFREDLFHGRGQLTLNEGRGGAVYEGVFEAGKCGKFGRLRYRDGGVYLGEMKDFRRHGNGIYLRPNGERFEGEFSNDTSQGML